MSWNKVLETNSRWLKRENLYHGFTRVIYVNDKCGCVQMCLEGLKPKKKHDCNDLEKDILENDHEFRIASEIGR